MSFPKPQFPEFVASKSITPKGTHVGLYEKHPAKAWELALILFAVGAATYMLLKRGEKMVGGE